MLTLISASVRRCRRERPDAEAARVAAARTGQHLHQAVGIGVRTHDRIEIRFLRDERGDQKRIETAFLRILLQQLPVVDRENHLQDRRGQRFASRRQVLRIRPLHRVDAGAHVAEPLVRERNGGLQLRRIAPHALGVLQFIHRLAVEARRQQRDDAARGRNRRHRRGLSLQRGGDRATAFALQALDRQPAVIGVVVVDRR